MKEFYLNVKGYSFDKLFKKDLVTAEEILSLLEELYFENKDLKKEKERIIQDRNDNYRHVPYEEMI